MMADRAAGSSPGCAMLACHMPDDGAGDSAFTATRVSRNGNERENDRGQGKFQLRFHDDFSVCVYPSTQRRRHALPEPCAR
jgi:hypothetical protein